jgi:uncharacterized metal-binding protein YceD (DUF177 family)
VKHLDQYSVSFTGLSLGRHAFTFEVDNKFFACFEHSEITEGKLTIGVELEKSSTMLEFFFHIEGSVNVPCDVCTEDFDLAVDGDEKLIVKFGEEEYDNTDDIVILSPGEHEINLAQQIYEFINLAIPARRVHPEGECDPEMLARIEKYRVKNDEDDSDPRWDMLKNIKLN